MTVSGRFGVGTFGEFPFGEGTTHPISTTIESQSVVGPTGVFGMGEFGGFVFGESGIVLSVTRGIFTTINTISSVTSLLYRGVSIDVTILTISDTVFTLKVRWGYPLRVSVITSKRDIGLSSTRRTSGLRIDR